MSYPLNVISVFSMPHHQYNRYGPSSLVSLSPPASPLLSHLNHYQQSTSRNNDHSVHFANHHHQSPITAHPHQEVMIVDGRPVLTVVVPAISTSSLSSSTTAAMKLASHHQTSSSEAEVYATSQINSPVPRRKESVFVAPSGISSIMAPTNRSNNYTTSLDYHYRLASQSSLLSSSGYQASISSNNHSNVITNETEWKPYLSTNANDLKKSQQSVIISTESFLDHHSGSSLLSSPSSSSSSTSTSNLLLKNTSTSKPSFNSEDISQHISKLIQDNKAIIESYESSSSSSVLPFTNRSNHKSHRSMSTTQLPTSSSSPLHSSVISTQSGFWSSDKRGLHMASHPSQLYQQQQQLALQQQKFSPVSCTRRYSNHGINPGDHSLAGSSNSYSKLQSALLRESNSIKMMMMMSDVDQPPQINMSQSTEQMMSRHHLPSPIVSDQYLEPNKSSSLYDFYGSEPINSSQQHSYLKKKVSTTSIPDRKSSVIIRNGGGDIQQLLQQQPNVTNGEQSSSLVRSLLTNKTSRFAYEMGDSSNLQNIATTANMMIDLLDQKNFAQQSSSSSSSTAMMNNSDTSIIKDLLLKSKANSFPSTTTTTNTVTTASPPSTLHHNSSSMNRHDESSLPLRKRSRTDTRTSSTPITANRFYGLSFPNNGKLVDSVSSRLPTNNTTMTTYGCNLCDVTFRNQQNLEVHQRHYCRGNVIAESNQMTNCFGPINVLSKVSVAPKKTSESTIVMNQKPHHRLSERKVSVLERPSIISYSERNDIVDYTKRSSSNDENVDGTNIETIDLDRQDRSSQNDEDLSSCFGNILKSKLLQSTTTSKNQEPKDSDLNYSCLKLSKKRKTSEPAFRYFSDMKRESLVQKHRTSVLESHSMMANRESGLELISAYSPYLMRPATKITIKGPILFSILQDLIDSGKNHEFHQETIQLKTSKPMDLVANKHNSDSDLLTTTSASFLVKTQEDILMESSSIDESHKENVNEEVQLVLQQLLMKVDFYSKSFESIVEDGSWDDHWDVAVQCLDQILETVQIRCEKKVSPSRPTTLNFLTCSFDQSARTAEEYGLESRSTSNLSVFVNRCSYDQQTAMFQNNSKQGLAASQLIPSTLVSPDTPRPKRKYQQLFLDGHAYSNLGLKATLRPTYCCIYRLQPMFVSQEANPQLSMYSQWKTYPVPNGDILELISLPGPLLSAYNSQEAVFAISQHYGSMVVGEKEEEVTAVCVARTMGGLDNDSKQGQKSNETSFKLRKPILEFLENITTNRLGISIPTLAGKISCQKTETVSSDCLTIGDENFEKKRSFEHTIKSLIISNGDGFCSRLTDSRTRSHFIVTHSNYHQNFNNRFNQGAKFQSRKRSRINTINQIVQQNKPSSNQKRISITNHQSTPKSVSENIMGISSCESHHPHYQQDVPSSKSLVETSPESLESIHHSHPSAHQHHHHTFQPASRTNVPKRKRSSTVGISSTISINSFVAVHPMLGHTPPSSISSVKNSGEDDGERTMYMMLMSQTSPVLSIPSTAQMACENFASRKFSDCGGLRLVPNAFDEKWATKIGVDGSTEIIPRRIKIFEGGFKSNEDYTYIRGRGRGKYLCAECGIRCKKPSMLKKHIRTHTDLRPYSCRHCAFAFKTKGNLTKHMKSKAHHKKCVELNINPVPTAIEDSQIDSVALAKQEQYELSCSGSKSDFPSCYDDEFDLDEDYDDDDDEFDDEEEDDEGVPIPMIQQQQTATTTISSQQHRLTYIEPGQFDDANESEPNQIPHQNTIENLNNEIVTELNNNRKISETFHSSRKISECCALIDGSDSATNISLSTNSNNKIAVIIDDDDEQWQRKSLSTKTTLIPSPKVHSDNLTTNRKKSNQKSSTNEVMASKCVDAGYQHNPSDKSVVMASSKFPSSDSLSFLKIADEKPVCRKRSSLRDSIDLEIKNQSRHSIIIDMQNEAEAARSLLILSGGIGTSEPPMKKTSFIINEHEKQTPTSDLVLMANQKPPRKSLSRPETEPSKYDSHSAKQLITKTNKPSTITSSQEQSDQLVRQKQNIPSSLTSSHNPTSVIILNEHSKDLENHGSLRTTSNYRSGSRTSHGDDNYSNNRKLSHNIAALMTPQSFNASGHSTNLIGNLYSNPYYPAVVQQQPLVIDCDSNPPSSSSLIKSDNGNQSNKLVPNMDLYQNQHEQLNSLNQQVLLPLIMAADNHSTSRVSNFSETWSESNSVYDRSLNVTNQPLLTSRKSPSLAAVATSVVANQIKSSPQSLSKSLILDEQNCLYGRSSLKATNHQRISPVLTAMHPVVNNMLQDDCQPIDLSKNSKEPSSKSLVKPVNSIHQQMSPSSASSLSSCSTISPNHNKYRPMMMMEEQHLTEQIVKSFSTFDSTNVTIVSAPKNLKQLSETSPEANGRDTYQSIRSEEFAHLTPGVLSPHQLPKGMQSMPINRDRSSNRFLSGIVSASSMTSEGKQTCPTCMKQFSKPFQLRLHYNIHLFERPYRCESCAVSFRTKGHLQKHSRSVSHLNKLNMSMTFGKPSTDNPRPFKCTDCKIAFRIHGHLAKHLRSKMHIMKLECLGKLPFGMFAEMERSNTNLNLIDTNNCEKALESLRSLAQKLYDPRQICWKVVNEQEAITMVDDVIEEDCDGTDEDDLMIDEGESFSIDDSQQISGDAEHHQLDDIQLSNSELASSTTPPPALKSSQSIHGSQMIPFQHTNQTTVRNDSVKTITSNDDATSSRLAAISTRSNTCHLCDRTFKAAKFLQVHLYGEHAQEMAESNNTIDDIQHQ